MVAIFIVGRSVTEPPRVIIYIAANERLYTISLIVGRREYV